jgi:rhomboid domain-containing protein 1
VANTPLITLVLLVVNILIHIIVFLFSIDISPFTFNPYFIVYRYEYYRVFTSAFLHGGILHIAMNMMSLITLGGLLEPTYGSLRFLWITWAAILLAAVNYIFFAWLSSVIMQNPAYMFSNSIGYSGVLFSYTAIESFHASSPYRSVFGLFSVPTKLYPLILLGVIQFILPNISFFGHLGGLCAGLMLISSFGEWFVLPSIAACESIETSQCCSMCRRQSAYRLLTSTSLLHSSLEIRCASTNTNSGSICSTVYSVVGTLVSVLAVVVGTVCQLLYTILYIIGFPIDFLIQRSQACYAQTIGRCVSLVQSCIQSMSTHSANQESASSGFDVENQSIGAGRRTGGQSPQRLNTLPTMISSTPLLSQSSNEQRSQMSPGAAFYTNYGLGNSRRDLVHGGTNAGQGYELVSQQVPDSHFTNTPVHNNESVPREQASTMIEVIDEDEGRAASATRLSPPKAALSNTASNSASSNTQGQYYHRSKQNSRLLNPELYSNSNDNSGSGKN